MFQILSSIIHSPSILSSHSCACSDTHDYNRCNNQRTDASIITIPCMGYDITLAECALTRPLNALTRPLKSPSPPALDSECPATLATHWSRDHMNGHVTRPQALSLMQRACCTPPPHVLVYIVAVSGGRHMVAPAILLHRACTPPPHMPPCVYASLETHLCKRMMQSCTYI